MERIQRTTVENRIQNGYQFEFSEYLSYGFKIFSKEWLMFSLYGLVSTFILIFSFFTLIGFALLFYPTMLGFAVAAEKVEKGEKLEFGDFFGAFKNFGEYFILGIMLIVFIILLFVPYFASIFILMENPDSTMAVFGMIGSMLFMMLMIVGIYFLQIALFFAPYLIHFGNYSAKEAIGTSYKLAKKNFWWFLLFVFVVGLISGVGQYVCLVGMFASMAVGMLMNYSVVKKVLMDEGFNEIDEIGQTEFRNN